MVGLLDDQVGERARDGVDDDPTQLPAGAVAAGDLAADHQRLRSAHRTPFSLPLIPL
jgi:hypothetical protein